MNEFENDKRKKSQDPSSWRRLNESSRGSSTIEQVRTKYAFTTRFQIDSFSVSCYPFRMSEIVIKLFSLYRTVYEIIYLMLRRTDRVGVMSFKFLLVFFLHSTRSHGNPRILGHFSLYESCIHLVADNYFPLRISRSKLHLRPLKC